MAQHVLLLTVAPPLIVLAAPWTQIWRPLPLGFRRTVAKAVVAQPAATPASRDCACARPPAVAWLLFNVNLLVWHAPAPYDATLRNETLHDLEHATFFFTGLLFWAQVFDSPPFRARLDWLQRVGLLVDRDARRLGPRDRARLRAAPLYAPTRRSSTAPAACRR